jgi:thiosulfate/3-mercaptopyruvate sulfurtransferase
MGPLIDAAGLRELLGEPELSVVDCRFVLGQPGAGRPLYLEGHVPGAAFVDVDSDLSGPPGLRGRHPLPDPAQFEAAARRAGISSSSFVVAYDDHGEGGAVRLWWLLRHFGHGAVAVLDGGLRAWLSAGAPVRSGSEEITPGNFSAEPAADDLVAAEELGEGGWTLVDARAPERFRGEVEPIDPVAGHIPGAVNAPFTELAPGGRFLSPGELRERLGPGPLVAYCGSGITAPTVVLAAELAGIEARLYPGGWSEWCRRG